MADHLHFVFIPLMAPGHIIPMIDMAKLFAARGATVTIVVTPLDATRFCSAVGSSIRLLRCRFPAEEAGLPPGCESVDLVPSYHLIYNFYEAIKLLQIPLEEILIHQIDPLPSCIISDKHISWTVETCAKLRIPRIVFDGMSCFTQLVMQRLYVSRVHESVPPMDPFVVPGVPDRIEFTRVQLPGIFNPGSVDVSGAREEVRRTEWESYGVVINTFEELENRYVDEFRKVRGGKVWCIGPFSLSSSNDAHRCYNQASIDVQECLNWLDKRNPGSVIFACHGSLSRLSPDQFTQLALALESSGHPFIVVVKGGSRAEEIEKWISDEGFEERTKERGLVIRGWAPQVVILSHPSVGAFLTHCGWNSTLEGVCAGLPMITWPIFAEQFLNEKLMVQILETGVGVGAKAVVHLGERENDGDKVGMDGIKMAIDKVMDEGEEGCERRKRAQELAQVAKRSVQVGGSSYHNITLLIQEIAQLVEANKHIE